MRVLIFGGTGMLGHKLAQILAPAAETIVTLRGGADQWPDGIPVDYTVGGVDVRNTSQLAALLEEHRPDAVLNAVGVVKQIIAGHDPADTIAVNAVYPVLLGRLCASRGIRLIHYSTDCVFSGAAASERGPDGYREIDLPDARDLYGMSKLLGEPAAAGSLVLRTSIIGRELRGKSSLVEWFLAQGKGPVRGFTRALFTGLTTLELARVTSMILHSCPDLAGLWHVAAPPVSKCVLLELVNSSYDHDADIRPEDSFYCDRRLDGTRFTQATSWQPPPWPEMIAAMRNDTFSYEAA